jgi:hypothetical protein
MSTGHEITAVEPAQTPSELSGLSNLSEEITPELEQTLSEQGITADEVEQLLQTGDGAADLMTALEGGLTTDEMASVLESVLGEKGITLTDQELHELAGICANCINDMSTDSMEGMFLENVEGMFLENGDTAEISDAYVSAYTLPTNTQPEEIQTA